MQVTKDDKNEYCNTTVKVSVLIEYIAVRVLCMHEHLQVFMGV